MTVDILRIFERQNPNVGPQWSGRLPDKEYERICEKTRAINSSLIPAYHRVDFHKSVNTLEIAHTGALLGEVSEWLQKRGGLIYFIRDGNTLIPQRKRNVSEDEARDILNDILGFATQKLIDKKLPVIGVPAFNPFKPKQLGEK